VNAAAGRYDKAEHYYREALKRNPQSELILMDLATLYELQKQYGRAIELYQQILAANPNSALVRKRLGGLYIGQKKLDEALLQFHVLETIEPDPEETRIKIALIYFEKGEYDRAATELNLVLAAEPDNDRVRYYLGSVYAETKEYPKALEIFEKVKPEAEFYVDSRVQIAAIYQKQDKGGAAIAELDHALSVKGRNPELLRQGCTRAEELPEGDCAMERRSRSTERRQADPQPGALYDDLRISRGDRALQRAIAQPRTRPR
jgi:tetratricopeptide (TPR) repeat protein